MANQEQLERLLQGAKGWNQWRQENPGIIPNLDGAYLCGVYLRGADLRYAKLSGANLSYAKLSRADLRGAFLRGAFLRGAFLRGADLRYAFLHGADLRYAFLHGADLRGANLSYAKLSRAFLRGADLRGAYLSYAKLSRADLEGADLEGADLEGADFEVFKDADFEVGIFEDFGSMGGMGGANLEADNLSKDYLELKSLFESLDSLSPEKCDPPSAFCYVSAEMDERVVVNRPTSVEVVVSKELLERATTAVSQGGSINLKADQRLIVQVVPKTNFVPEGDDRFEVDPPEKGKPQTLNFDLRATHLGEGEVWVVLRQTQQALLTLILRPQIVENRNALKASAPMQLLSAPPAASSEASSAQRIRATESVTDLPTPSASLHQLRIIERRNGNQITYLYELNSPLLAFCPCMSRNPLTVIAWSMGRTSTKKLNPVGRVLRETRTTLPLSSEPLVDNSLTNSSQTHSSNSSGNTGNSWTTLWCFLLSLLCLGSWYT
jgi:hypothetical protein